MNEFEKLVKNQMLIEFPEMVGTDVKFRIKGREFEDIGDIDALAHYVAGEMWNTFDATLFHVETGRVVYE